MLAGLVVEALGEVAMHMSVTGPHLQRNRRLQGPSSSSRSPPYPITVTSTTIATIATITTPDTTRCTTQQKPVTLSPNVPEGHS
mgnify:CR=1 FL=1